MGKSSRDKGLRRERAIVDIHMKCGLRAERVPLSGAVRYRGNGADVDLYVRGAEPLKAEVKARGEGLVIGLTNLPLVYEGDALFHLVRTVGEQVNATELEVPAGGLGPDAEEADEALTYG